MQNNTLTSDSMSFFSLQDAIADVVKLLYNEKVVTKITVSKEFYNKIKNSYDLVKFDNDVPEKFYGVILEIKDEQSEPYKIYYDDKEETNAR